MAASDYAGHDRLSRGAGGFTVLEMAAATAIMAALSGVVAVAMTTTADMAHVANKRADLRSVDAAVEMFALESRRTPIEVGAEAPLEAVAGSGLDGTIRIVVDTAAEDFVLGELPGGEGVVRCNSPSSVEIARALAACLAAIAFDDLVPVYLKSAPMHSEEDASEVGQHTLTFDDVLGTPDVVMKECTIHRENCEFFFADAGDAQEPGPPYTVPPGSLRVWNVDGDNSVVVLKPERDYGRVALGDRR